MVLQQGSQFAASGRRAGFVDEVFQNDARVIRTAEESTINAPADIVVDPSSRPQQHRAKDGAERDTARHSCFRQELQVTCKEQRKADRHDCTDEHKQKYESPLHQKISSTSPQQDRNFEYTVSDHSIGKGERK